MVPFMDVMDHEPPERGANGRFQKGHKRLPGAGKLAGKPNTVTSNLRAVILGGASDCGYDGRGKDGLRGFVRRLCEDNPVAGAALISRLLPKSDLEDDDNSKGAHVTSVTVISVPSGVQLMKEQLEDLRVLPPLPAPMFTVISNNDDGTDPPEAA
jgi:hypothetical protein